jgi:protein-S-isoprenylcysteine O-methyltransferase Ste14
MNNLYLRAVLAALAGFCWFFAVIFIPAWTFNYWQGWAFFLTLAILTSLATIYIAAKDKDLLERRMRMGPSVEKTSTQKIITALGSLLFIPAIILMVLDHRFGWSPAVPTFISILGDVLAALGIVIYILVVRENRFAAATVDVVEGQTVVSTGPYAIVRHPMYTGALLVFIGAPLALGSWWGLLTVPVFVAGFAWRLLHEEEFLREHLSGYTEYMGKVRYRLLPYVW